jgi:hypothetical protein
MTTQSPGEPPETGNVVTDHYERSKYFLLKGRQHLAEGDLHQASEKGWGAAAHMAKAVAAASSWRYETHDEFDDVLSKASQLTQNYRIHDLGNAANYLHRNYYKRKAFLEPRLIQRNLDNVEELIGLLEPLTR